MEKKIRTPDWKYLNINYISILFSQRSELSDKRNFKNERKIIQTNDL